MECGVFGPPGYEPSAPCMTDVRACWYWVGLVPAEDSRCDLRIESFQFTDQSQVSTLIHGHELWVVAERTRLWVHEAEMSFLRRVAGLCLPGRTQGSWMK